MGSVAKKAKRKGLRQSINDYCRYCIYDPHAGNGTWREQVEACTAPECPLYPVRPMSAKRQPAREGA